MMILNFILCFLLATDVVAKCRLCSLFSDYYDDVAQEVPLQRLEKSLDESSARLRTIDRPDRVVMDSLGHFSDMTSSLLSNLLDVIGEKTPQVSFQHFTYRGNICGKFGMQAATVIEKGVFCCAEPITPDDIPAILRGGRRRIVVTPRVETKTQPPRVTDKLFDIFDTIGSGILKVSHLDGPHVCIRESTTRSSSNGSTKKVEKKCLRFKDARKCIDSRTDSKGTRETLRLEECCEGYETNDIFKHGCPFESTVLRMEKVLAGVNSSLWSLAESADVTRQLSADNITVFVSKANKMKADDPASYVLNRIVPGAYRDYDWTSGDVLKTLGGGKYVITQSEDGFGTIKSYVNCLPLDSSSQRASNGIVHLVAGDLQPSAESLLAALSNDSRFSIFESLLSDDLRETLSSNGSFTVFAPSNKALSSLSASLQKDIKAGAGCASDFARSHIVKGTICSYDLYNRQLTSLTGSEIETHTQLDGGERVTLVGKAKTTIGDIFAKNGVIHLIDDIVFNDELMPWRELLDVHNQNLKEALENVVGNSSDKLTIFVPPTGNESLTFDFARNHVVLGEAIDDFKSPSSLTTEAKSTIFTGYSPKTSPIFVRLSVLPRRERGQVGCTKITKESVKGCRAVLQFIEKPLPLVTDNFDTFLAKREDLSKFNRLWRESSQNSSLSGEKPITAFIPSDDAFSNNEFKRLLADPKLLDFFVKRHIVNEPLCQFDLRHSPSEIRIQTYSNLNGEALRPTQTDGETFIDGSRLQETEIVLSNGVAHVLETTIVEHFAATQPRQMRRRPIGLLDIIS